ncbi:unnamed protein product [Ceratitis capitata]|uniref:(Mediterranean fruit fly) hypothetical protein n=1 Tax=Ceratitis capitata TaxID=7213 RepID=A0A811VLD9_CERCA|nr:unnamed protein product [Ceratitis capitata]
MYITEHTASLWLRVFTLPKPASGKRKQQQWFGSKQSSSSTIGSMEMVTNHRLTHTMHTLQAEASSHCVPLESEPEVVSHMSCCHHGTV